MTTASETTLKLLRDRIAALRLDEQPFRDRIAYLEAERDKTAQRLALTVAQREALEADLAALTVADDRDDDDADLDDEELREPVCSVCGLPIQTLKRSPTGWVHDPDAYAREHETIREKHGGSTWPQPVGYDVPTEKGEVD